VARSRACAETLLIAITGASGYIGAHCVFEALRRQHRVLALSTQPARSALLNRGDQLRWQFVGEHYSTLDHSEWVKRLSGVHTLIHCAARVHQTGSDAASLMHRDNALLTKMVVSAAREAGVARFIFLSSAAVFGEAVNLPAYSVNANRIMGSAYSRSKIEAEDFLLQRQVIQGEALDILRPPVVYGRDAPGNMMRLAKWAASGYPLPFGAIVNRRSIVSIRSLVNAIFWCVERPVGSGSSDVWHPTDRQSLSTTQIVNAIGRGLKRAPRNWSAPNALLRAALIATGQRRIAQQLLDSWELDSSALTAAGFDGAMDAEIELEFLGRSLR
jgi:nucleoside-diphosphate-sugar epimerase